MAKGQDTRKQAGAGLIKPPFVDTLIIAAHCWVGDHVESQKSLTVNVLLRKGDDPRRDVFQLAEAPNGANTANIGELTDSISKIYRIVFYPLGTDTHPPLVIDVHPDGSSLNLEDHRRRVRISAKILCALDRNADYIRMAFGVNIQIEGRLPKYEEFTLYEKNLLYVRSQPLLTLKELLTRDSTATPHAPAAGPPLIFVNKLLNIATKLELPKFVPPTCYSPIATDSKDHSVIIQFPKITEFGALINIREDVHTLELTLKTGDTTKCSQEYGTIRTFWARGDDEDSAREGYRYNKTEVPWDWEIKQRAALSITSKPHTGLRRDSPGALWILHAYGVPGNAAVRTWNRLATPYLDHVIEIKGGRPLSLLPTFDRLKTTQTGRWVMTYSIEDSDDSNDDVEFIVDQDVRQPRRSTRVTPLSLYFSPERDADNLTLIGLSRLFKTLDGSPLNKRSFILQRSFMTRLVRVREGNFETSRGVVLSPSLPAAWIETPLPSPPYPVTRIGALDLVFGPITSTAEIRSHEDILSIRRVNEYSGSGEHITGAEVKIEANFVMTNLQPGGQDDPDLSEEVLPEGDDSLAEKCLKSKFRQKRPIVISPPEPLAHVYLMQVDESNNPQNRSQTVRLKIRSTTQTKALAPNDSVIVLDRNPFLVAQVQYPVFLSVDGSGDNTVADWTSESPTGAGWQLQFDQRDFSLVLPPQALGEEMIKDTSLTPDPRVFPQSIDFALGPQTVVKLNPRVAQTLFSEPPWNLRRILGTPGQPQAGPLVLQLQYELLYGLSCDADNPAIRLAEIFSRVGRIPSMQHETIRWGATVAQDRAYQNARDAWSRLYGRYLSRIAVLEPWDTILPAEENGKVTLKRGLTCRFRLPPKSAVKSPFDAAAASGLKGGATWGFESKNIYTAVTQQPRRDGFSLPSSSATLSDAALSSLGGWGKQKAGFQNDLTKVYGDVSMGRAYRYTLERVGRIGVMWNLAKHVIVYERTVIPSDQFVGSQSKLEGWPVLRKIEEYIEITEDKRAYPDDLPETARSTTDASAAAKISLRKRGFVAHCAFEVGARIRVDGAWGSDVGDYGWKIPLWNPSADPKIYPKPLVTLGVVSHLDENTPTVVPCRCDEPHNIYFFTQTRASAGSSADPDPDPHKWPPVVGIDYVNKPRPQPPVGPEFDEFELHGDPRQYAPEEPSVPAGYGPCTFRLEPSQVQATIVAERVTPKKGVKPLGAVLDSVTMVRARISEDWPDSAKEVATVYNRVSTLFKEVLKALPIDEEILVKLPSPDFLTSLRQKLTGAYPAFTDGVTRAEQNVKAVEEEARRAVIAFEAETVERLKSKAEKAVGAPLEELKRRAKEIKDAVRDTQPSLDEAKANVKQMLERLQRSVEDQIALFNSLPGAMVEFFARYVDTIAELAVMLDLKLTEIDRALMNGTLSVDSAVAQLQPLISRANTLLRSLETFGQSLPIDWLPDPTRAVRGALTNYFAREEFQRLSDEMLTTVRRANQNVQMARDAIATFRANPIYTTLQNPTRLREFVRDKLAFAVVSTDGFNELRNKVHLTRSALAGLLRRWQTIIRDQVFNPTNRLEAIRQLEAIERAINIWLLAKDQGLQKAIKDLQSDLDAHINAAAAIFKDALGGVTSEFDAIKAQLESVLSDTGKTIEQMRDKIHDLRDRAGRVATDYLDRASGPLVRDAGAVLQNADNALQLVRAFGQPPRAPNLDFDRSRIAYYFRENVPAVDITPVISLMNRGAALIEQGQDVLTRIKPLGVKLPTRQALEELIPANLRNFDLSQVIPNFAGLDLKGLLSAQKLGGIDGNNIRITHGLDAQRRRAFVRGDVDFPLDDPATLFTIGPVSVQLARARFTATTLIEVDNGRVLRKVNGRISADWQVVISGNALISFRDTALTFDDSGGIRFSIDPSRIEMSGVLAFLTDLLKGITGDSGLTIGVLPNGFQSVLNLPLPDTQAGAFGITNLRISAALALTIENGGFQIALSCGLASKEAPFALTIFILGGGGYFLVTARYQPSRGSLSCVVEVGITASASLAIALGPIKGGVYVYFGITARFESGGPGLTIGVLFIICGEVSVLGLVSACVRLMLEATYNSSTGRLTGRGRLTISIKICWCFTLDLDFEVTYSLGGSDGDQVAMTQGERPLLASLEPTALPPAEMCNAMTDPYDKYACYYVEMLD